MGSHGWWRYQRRRPTLRLHHCRGRAHLLYGLWLIVTLEMLFKSVKSPRETPVEEPDVFI